MLILGLDPGTARTGYGVVREYADGYLEAVEYGVFLTKAKTPMPERLQQLHEQVSACIAKHQPDAAAIEELFFGKNVTTGIKVAQARGVLLLALAQASLPIEEYKPNNIKIAITGYGGADKTQMQEMIRQLLNLQAIPKPDDAADGLAVALTYLQSTRYDRLSQS